MIPRALQAPLRFAVLAAVALAGAGCGGDSGTPPLPPVDWDAIDPVEFSAHLLPLFEVSCNTAECHGPVDRAFGLSLANYDDVAAGSRFGAVVLPYEPDHSHIVQHVTGELEPRMPIGRDPLEPGAIRAIERWVRAGAPDDDGTPMYADVTSKTFVACQGDNQVAVLDLDTGYYVRTIPVEKPHSVYVDAPNRRVFVSRLETASDNIQVYDADTLQRIRVARAGTFPALMKITPDGSQLWVTNFDQLGGDNRVRVLDPDTLAEIESFDAPASLQLQPHGLAISSDGAWVYVTNILSDNVSVYCTGCDAADGSPDLVDFAALPAQAGAQQPQQCVLSEDDSRLYVSALGVDRVYVMDTATLAFLGEVVVGDAPWHLALAPGGNELWVANWVGQTVSVVDVSNPAAPVVTATLDPDHPEDPGVKVLHRPIGIAFSPDGNRVWVACANDDGSGSGHHPPPDGERPPGSVVVFDRATREVVSVTEVPFFARFVSFLP